MSVGSLLSRVAPPGHSVFSPLEDESQSRIARLFHTVAVRSIEGGPLIMGTVRTCTTALSSALFSFPRLSSLESEPIGDRDEEAAAESTSEDSEEDWISVDEDEECQRLECNRRIEKSLTTLEKDGVSVEVMNELESILEGFGQYTSEYGEHSIKIDTTLTAFDRIVDMFKPYKREQYGPFCAIQDIERVRRLFTSLLERGFTVSHKLGEWVHTSSTRERRSSDRGEESILNTFGRAKIRVGQNEIDTSMFSSDPKGQAGKVACILETLSQFYSDHGVAHPEKCVRCLLERMAIEYASVTIFDLLTPLGPGKIYSLGENHFEESGFCFGFNEGKPSVSQTVVYEKKDPSLQEPSQMFTITRSIVDPDEMSPVWDEVVTITKS